MYSKRFIRSGDYEAVAQFTRSTSVCGSARPVKKSHHFLTTKIAKELPSPQRVLEVTGIAAGVHEPIIATQGATSEVAPATSKRVVIIVIGRVLALFLLHLLRCSGLQLLPVVLQLD